MILVAGGTGFLGRHIVRALAGHGYPVRILSRSRDRLPEFGQKDAFAGDVTDAGSLPPALAGCDAVVMAAQFSGHPMEKPRRGRSYDAVDRAGTENLIAAAHETGVRRIVYVSAAGVGRGRPESWFVAKDRAEAAVRASGLGWSILRPSWAYGEGDRALNRIAKIVRYSPIVPVLGWDRQRVMPVWAGDVGETVARTFDSDVGWGRALEIGGPDVLTMRQVVRTLVDVLGKRRLLVPIPNPLAKLATAPLSILPNPPLTPKGVDFATGDALVDNSACEHLGIRPVRLADGLRLSSVGR